MFYYPLAANQWPGDSYQGDQQLTPCYLLCMIGPAVWKKVTRSRWELYNSLTSPKPLIPCHTGRFRATQAATLQTQSNCPGRLPRLASWIPNYLTIHVLTSRSQSVALNGETSDLLPVKSGVPQGSLLGPLLFLMYVNDVNEVVLSVTYHTECADSCSITKIIKQC